MTDIKVILEELDASLAHVASLSREFSRMIDPADEQNEW